MEQLVRIYNTLSLISTRGEDTVLMAQSLLSLKDFIEKNKEENTQEAE